MSQYVHETNDANFEKDVLKADLPVLVDFWASWCMPCKAIAPYLEQVAKEYEGKIKVVKMDVDQNSETPVQYEVRSIPNLVIFKNGKSVAQAVGAMNKQQLSTFIDESITA